MPGFRTFVQTGIVLQVNGDLEINPTLEVGQVAETVEVQANAALVETRTTAVGQVIENETDSRTAAERTAGDRPDRTCRRRRSDRQQQSEHARAACRSRSRAACPSECRTTWTAPCTMTLRRFQPSDAVSRCTAGVQGRSQRICCRRRHAIRRRCERRDQVGHQRIPWRPLRICTQLQIQRA